MSALINKKFRKEVGINSLRLLAIIITGEIDGITQPHAFKGYVFIHNEAFFWKSSEIYYGIFSQSAEMTKSFTIIEYTENPLTSYAQQYKLFLFM